jgi:hypothetical protein
LREIVRCKNAAHTWRPDGVISANGVDPGARAEKRHELDVKRIVQPNVGGVLLRPCDSFDAPDSGQ